MSPYSLIGKSVTDKVQSTDLRIFVKTNLIFLELKLQLRLKSCCFGAFDAHIIHNFLKIFKHYRIRQNSCVLHSVKSKTCANYKIMSRLSNFFIILKDHKAKIILK